MKRENERVKQKEIVINEKQCKNNIICIHKYKKKMVA